MKRAGEFKNLIIVEPKILMPYELQAQVMAFVNGTNAQECQWFHTVTRTMSTKGDKAYYTLDLMFIPEQTVTGATVESPDKGMLTIYNELKETYKTDTGYDKETVNCILSSMHVWAHSHVNMQCSPSTTDETTFKQWIDQNKAADVNSPVIMMIVNKKEDIYFRLFDPEIGIYCENPSLEVIMPAVDTSYVTEAIKTKIKSGYSQIGSKAWSQAHLIQAQPQTAQVKPTTPTVEYRKLIVMGKNAFSGSPLKLLEDDIDACVFTSNCQGSVARIMKALYKLFSKQELPVFYALLKDKRIAIEDYVIFNRQISAAITSDAETDLAETFLKDWSWDENFFYALVGATVFVLEVDRKRTGTPELFAAMFNDLTSIKTISTETIQAYTFGAPL